MRRSASSSSSSSVRRLLAMMAASSVVLGAGGAVAGSSSSRDCRAGGRYRRRRVVDPSRPPTIDHRWSLLPPLPSSSLACHLRGGGDDSSSSASSSSPPSRGGGTTSDDIVIVDDIIIDEEVEPDIIDEEVEPATPQCRRARLPYSVSAGGGGPSPAAFVVGSDHRGARATTTTITTRAMPSSSAGGSSSSPPPAAIAGNDHPGGAPTTTTIATTTTTTTTIATAAATTGASPSSDEDDATASRPPPPPPPPPARNRRRPLRVLFLSSDTGGGHRASAEALAAQFRAHYPGTTYDLLDCWTDVESSWPYYTIRDAYKSLSSSPWKWRALYHVSNNVAYAKLADLHSHYMNEDLIRERMEGMDPDVVVSVHPTMNYVPLLAIRRISEKVGRDIPFFTVVTDFGSGHRHWFNKDVDKMYLASEPIKRIAQKVGGVPDEKIVMSGLPIRQDFASRADSLGGDRTTERGMSHVSSTKAMLGIDPSRRMVLVMGGGEGVGSLSDIVDELYAKFRTQGVDATVCVVCGRNEALRADLEARCWDEVVSRSLRSYESLRSRFYTKVLSMHAHRSRRIQLALDRAAAKAAEGRDVAERPGDVRVVPLGFVTNMADYMVAADVLVSKAGPGTIAEAASVGLPVMLTSYLPGQEAGNVDIVLNGGFGDFCEDPETIALEIACWLQEPELLKKMSRKAMKVGHPHAAEEIALDIGEMTQRWMERNEDRKKGVSGTDGP